MYKILSVVVKDAYNVFIPADKLKEKEITIDRYYTCIDKIKKQIENNFDKIINAS